MSMSMSITLTITGKTHYDIGFQHGQKLAKQFCRILPLLRRQVNDYFTIPFQKYVERSTEEIEPILITDYPDLYEELQGMLAGASHQKNGPKSLTLSHLIAWNAFLSYACTPEHIWPPKKQKKEQCSAFIATGTSTAMGEIIMAHTTHCERYMGEFTNIIMTIIPPVGKGNTFVMQTAPGLLFSSTDWYISSSGIMGCETTISDTNYPVEFESGKRTPIFCRARMSAQYGTTIDTTIQLLVEKNAGDYACCWLFGDIKTGEIASLEMGKNIIDIQKTNNGCFYGMNAPHSLELRTMETEDKQYGDIKTSSGARNARLNDLLNKKYKGNLTLNVAAEIIHDRYDVFLKKERKSKRNIWKEHVKNGEFYGSTDAKVTNTTLAKDMRFLWELAV